MKRTLTSLLLSLTLFCAGCHASPNVEIVGSYFPAWMLCVVLAVLVTLLLHLLARSLAMEEKLEPAVLVYTSITVIFTCLIWLVVYS